MNKAKSRLTKNKRIMYALYINKKSIIDTAILFAAAFTAAAVAMYYKSESSELLNPHVSSSFLPPAQSTSSLGVLEIKETTSEVLGQGDILYSGKISYYSHAGCLGCHPQQLMGNGQPFDENDMTLAVPCEDVIKPAKIKYNTKVVVTNQDTGKQVRATITDCGGFSKYNRVADLSLGLARELDAKTDQTNIIISLEGGTK